MVIKGARVLRRVSITPMVSDNGRRNDDKVKNLRDRTEEEEVKSKEEV